MTSEEGWPGVDFGKILTFEGFDIEGSSVRLAVNEAQDLVSQGRGDEVIGVPCEPGMAPAELFLSRLTLTGLSREAEKLRIY